MNDQFVNEAIRNDRYLKAIRLTDRFEDELRGELVRIGDKIVAEHPDVFAADVEASWRNSRSSRSSIAFARVDYRMTRWESTVADSKQLKFNITLIWMDPVDMGHPDVDGALFVTSYKIKNAARDDFSAVKAQTSQENWGLQFADDPFGNSPGIAYIPVESAEELREAHETLKDHFSVYGDEYGVAGHSRDV